MAHRNNQRLFEQKMRQTDEWEREAKARNREADKKHHMDLAQKKGWAVQANKGVMEQIR